MKLIIKNQEPQTFIDWKATMQDTFERYYEEGKTGDELYGLLQSSRSRNPEEGVLYFTKEDLRLPLLAEQGFICCYCNQRILNNHLTTLEHYQDKSTHPRLTFTYANLLASCNGNRNVPKRVNQHCDAAKDNESIPLTPLDGMCEVQLYFLSDGQIKAHCEEGEETINKLNLNTGKLVKLRREAIEGWLFSSSDLTGLIDVETAQLSLEQIEQRDANNHFIVFQSAVKSVLLREILNQKIEA
jgi:uncharacterized protein (TIGR02646 family)